MTQPNICVPPTRNKDQVWWRGGVIYQIYPRSYLDRSGDGIGDLAGIIDRLDYVAALGVDAIWISPCFVSPMEDFGYDVADFRDIDPMFGTIEQFDHLLAEAHARNLRVLVDLVLSHSSSAHPWFAESRKSRDNAKADWYVWADPKPDGTPPTNWHSVFGGPAWEWDGRRRQYYLHNFLTSQPDLNYHNPAVQDAVLDIVRFWLERGVDGFRLDTVNMYFHDQQLRDNPPIKPGTLVSGVSDFNPYAMQDPCYNISRPENLGFVERLREVMDQFPGTACVGEIGLVTDMYKMLADYTAGDSRLHMAYSFDYMTEECSAKHIRTVSQRMEAGIGDGWPSWAFSNHDTVRAVTRWGFADKEREAAPLLAAMLTSLRGTACLYQGEELGLPEADVPYERLQDPYGKRFWPDYKGRDGCRTPMPWQSAAQNAGFSSAEPWLPIPQEHNAFAFDGQDGDPHAPLERIRTFLNWRRNHPALWHGSITFIETAEPIVAFWREHGDEALLCLFNLSAEQQEVDMDSLVGERMPIKAIAGHGFFAERDACLLRLPAFSAFFGTDEG